MYFLVEVEKLLNIVSELKMVASQASEELDSYIFIDSSTKSVYFLCSSGERSVDFVVKDGVELHKSGRTAISYKKLLRFTQAFKELAEPGCMFEFRTEPGVLIVTFKNKDGRKKANVKLQTINHQKIPIPSEFTDTSFIINGSTIKAAVAKVKHSIDSNHAVAALRNVYVRLDSEKSTVSFVGTNGVVLSEAVVTVPVDRTVDYLIPIRYLIAMSMVNDADIPILVGVHDDEVKFNFGGGCYHGAVQKGLTFQEGYGNILNDYNNSIDIDVVSALPAISALLGVLDKDVDPVITLLIKDKKLQLKHDFAAFDLDHGTAGIKTEVIVHVSGSYLMRAFQAHSRTDKVSIGFKATGAPIVFRNISDEISHCSVIAPRSKR